MRHEAMGRTTEPRHLIILAVTAAILVECAGPDGNTQNTPPAVEAIVVACVDGGELSETPLATVRIVPAGPAPASFRGTLAASMLWGFGYVEALSSQAVRVGGLPRLPGTIELPLPGSPGPRIVSGSPPTAQIPIEEESGEGVLVDLLLGRPGAIRIEAPEARTLEGRSVVSPLGRVTVDSVTISNAEIQIDLQFDWVPLFAEGGALQPRGSLSTVLEVDGRRALGLNVSFVAEAGDRQSLIYQVPPDSSDGAITLVLDQWGFQYLAQVPIVDDSTGCL